MKPTRPPLFWKRWLEPTVIVTFVRWYLRFSLSLRDVKELMAERGLSVITPRLALDASFWPRGLSASARRSEAQISTWHMDETFVRVAGRWMYLFRAVDSGRQTVDIYLSETRDCEAAKLFLKRASESRQSASSGFRLGWTAQLSRGYPRVAPSTDRNH